VTTPPNGQARQIPPVDPGNELLNEVPAQLTTGLVPTPGGQRLVLTIRTATTTLTVFLAKEYAENWRDIIVKDVSRMNGLILPP